MKERSLHWLSSSHIIIHKTKYIWANEMCPPLGCALSLDYPLDISDFGVFSLSALKSWGWRERGWLELRHVSWGSTHTQRRPSLCGRESHEQKEKWGGRTLRIEPISPHHHLLVQNSEKSKFKPLLLGPCEGTFLKMSGQNVLYPTIC